MWIVALALRRTYTFVVMALVIAVLAAVVIWRMPVDIFPEIDIPVVTVVWSYTGMSAADIERRIILVNERVLTATVNDIEHIESQSLFGVGVIRIYLHPGAHIDAAIAEVSATCETVLNNMPPGITPPLIVRYSATGVPIIQINANSDRLTEQQIFDYTANFVIQRLGTVQGAVLPQPAGGKPRQVMVDLDLTALYARGLSPQDVSNAITAQNLIVPAGTVKIGDREYNVDLNASPDIVRQFNDIPVKTTNGATIYLSDVAHVRDGYAVQTNVVRRDGRRSVLMTVLKGEGASTLSVVDRLRAALPGVKAQLPPELNLDLLFDQSVFVRAAINGVLVEGATAAALTALMILLFLGSWRSTLIVATSIPMSILVSVIVLSMLGQTLNLMTLGGMALAVGILVDDATVEIENVHRNLGMKKPIKRAILDGAQQIATPAFVSTLAICIVFVPVVFLIGPAAYLFTSLAMAVVFAMLASYFLSRTLIPTMVLYLLPVELELYQGGGHGPAHRSIIWRVHEAFEYRFEQFRDAYGAMLGWCLKHRILALSVMMVFAVSSFALYPFVGRDFFPAVDAGQMRLYVRTPSGTRIEETERYFGRVEAEIRDVIPPRDLKLMLDNMGLPPFYTPWGFNVVPSLSVSDGEILIALNEDHRPTEEYTAALRERLGKKFPECTFSFRPADIVGQILNFGLPAPIDVQVVGLKREENLAVARKLRDRIAGIPGVVDAHIRQVTDWPDVRLDVDRVLANQLGLTQRDVANSLLVSLSSTTQVSPNFWVDPKSGVNYRVAVQTPQRQINSIGSLLETPIITGGATETRIGPDGLPTPRPQLLSNLTKVTRVPSQSVINHYNIQPVFDVLASVQARDLGAVAAEIAPIVKELRENLPRGSSIAVRGQIESMNSSFNGLAFGLVFAVLLVYLLMVVNFQSWLDPFIILTALPGALAGILWMLFTTRTTLSVPALMGAMMCVGVATSNSILMVTFANDQRRDGHDSKSSARSAGETRLRPVIMTASAMIIGMLLMSLGLSEGGEQNAPLGRAVIGGLLVATAFTLFFVPIAYSILRQKSAPPRDEELDDLSDAPRPETAAAH